MLLDLQVPKQVARWLGLNRGGERISVEGEKRDTFGGFQTPSINEETVAANIDSVLVQGRGGREVHVGAKDRLDILISSGPKVVVGQASKGPAVQPGDSCSSGTTAGEVTVGTRKAIEEGGPAINEIWVRPGQETNQLNGRDASGVFVGPEAHRMTGEKDPGSGPVNSSSSGLPNEPSGSIEIEPRGLPELGTVGSVLFYNPK